MYPEIFESIRKGSEDKSSKLVIDSDATGIQNLKIMLVKMRISQTNLILCINLQQKEELEKYSKKIFKDYEKEGANIKKIRVDINEADGNPLSFDTEKMKEKEYVVVTDTLTQEPRIDELKVQMLDKIRNY